MRHWLFTLLILFTVEAHGQEKSKGFTAVGLVGSLDYTNRTLDYSSANEWISKARDANETGNTGFTVYSQVQYKFNERLRIEGGVGYSNRSYKTKFEDLYWTSDDPGLPVKSRTIHRFKYITLPLSTNYSIYTRNRLSVYITAGIATNIFLARRTSVESLETDGDDVGYAFSKRSGYTKFTATVRGGAGIEYKVMKRFALRVEPNYQRTIRPITSDDDAKEYIYALGLATGMFYSF